MRQQLRRQIKSERSQLSTHERFILAKQATRHIINSPFFLQNQHLGFYLSVNGELDPYFLLEHAWQMKKICYLPVLHTLKANRLWFVRYHPGDILVANHLGILQPQINLRRTLPPWALDLIFVPLVAFDLQGNRLGMGGGYYDRTFADKTQPSAKSKPKLVGLAYEFQKVPQLAKEPWDVALDWVVTPTRMYCCDH